MRQDARTRDRKKRWDEGIEGRESQNEEVFFCVVFLPLLGDGVTRCGRRRREQKV